MYKLHIFLQFEPVFSTSVGSYSSETGAIFGLQLEAVCCKVIFEKHLRQIPKALCDAKGFCFMHYSEMHNKVLRRWLALSYCLYCLRLAALYHFILHSTIQTLLYFEPLLYFERHNRRHWQYQCATIRN